MRRRRLATRRRRRVAGDLQSRINITPLVDVVLVLLIIFMVIVPLTLHGYDLDIPDRATATPPADGRPEQVVLRVSLDGCPIAEPPRNPQLPADCHVRVNDEVVDAGDLAGKIAGTLGARPRRERVLFLVVDDRLNYEAVMRIVDAARSRVEGLRIGMVADPSSAGPSAPLTTAGNAGPIAEGRAQLHPGRCDRLGAKLGCREGAAG